MTSTDQTPAVDAGDQSEVPWQSLSVRVIVVDFVKSLLVLLPAVIAIVFVNIEPTFQAMWPFLAFAAWGVLSAIADVVRWLFTRYRVTPTEVERRTGWIVREHRSVRRDRIRSVDTHAKWHHRLAGLRMVTIGAGQQANAGESAFVLNSLTRGDAEQLRHELLCERHAATGVEALKIELPDAGAAVDQALTPEPVNVEILATLRPHWVLYNMFNLWAYLTAVGLLWGAYWLASTFGIDLLEFSSRWFHWEEQGMLAIFTIALIGGGLFGVISMGVSFLLGYWNFELARVQGESTSYLRTRRGLLSTREVNRDESRTRGLAISEPLFWRWIGMTDTNLLTTGLSMWSVEQPSALLPRGPRGIARKVAADVLGTPSPIETPFAPHPKAALRRRLWWATAATGIVLAFLAFPVSSGAVPLWVLWVALGAWPVALAGAVAAYLALGHAIVDEYVVMRSGMLSRTTSALRRDAVSTIALRESILQRRLRLCTVSTMTSAGWSTYEAPDVASNGAVCFATQAAPGILDEFLEPELKSRT